MTSCPGLNPSLQCQSKVSKKTSMIEGIENAFPCRCCLIAYTLSHTRIAHCRLLLMMMKWTVCSVGSPPPPSRVVQPNRPTSPTRGPLGSNPTSRISLYGTCNKRRLTREHVNRATENNPRRVFYTFHRGRWRFALLIFFASPTLGNIYYRLSRRKESYLP
ncbi:hypothetical protein BU16DRAFT_20640 [Lophium mytilinum]|uniref:Uncharacterized protein n=1 Tax=Lophium mytilinum TaxID=390894 RepID=A0A6A6RDA7_9PEZI|nr:hypothetical protein BU16DRAFT_20640 [Lophium mytilinum]